MYGPRRPRVKKQRSTERSTELGFGPRVKNQRSTEAGVTTHCVFIHMCTRPHARTCTRSVAFRPCQKQAHCSCLGNSFGAVILRSLILTTRALRGPPVNSHLVASHGNACREGQGHYRLKKSMHTHTHTCAPAVPHASPHLRHNRD